MRRWNMLIVALGLLPITGLMMMPSLAVANDVRSAMIRTGEDTTGEDTKELEPVLPVEPMPPQELPEFVHENAKCENLPRGTSYTARLCTTLNGFCSGACYIGVTAEPVRGCVPSPGSRCVTRPRFIRVTVQKEANCEGTDRCDCPQRIPPVERPYSRLLPASTCS